MLARMLPKTQSRATRWGVVVALSLVFLCVVSGLILGFLASGAQLNFSFGGTSNPKVQNVAISVVPDRNAPTQDAFILAGNSNNDTIFTKVGQLVSFTITTDDNAQNMNFSGSAGLPFTVLAYNKNGTEIVSTSYSPQDANGMVVAHTFTTSFFSIPLPPISIVTFSYTFAKAGTYVYRCLVPCGLGMGIPGYMNGEIVVQ